MQKQEAGLVLVEGRHAHVQGSGDTPGAREDLPSLFEQAKDAAEPLPVLLGRTGRSQ
jgi:hypothetical protein